MNGKDRKMEALRAAEQRFRVSRSGDKVRMKLSGSLYVEDAADFREVAIVMSNGGCRFFEVNVSDLEYIDSSGLGVLVGINNRCVKVGGFLLAEGARGAVKDLFVLTRLDLVFRMAR